MFLFQIETFGMHPVVRQALAGSRAREKRAGTYNGDTSIRGTRPLRPSDFLPTSEQPLNNSQLQPSNQTTGFFTTLLKFLR